MVIIGYLLVAEIRISYKKYFPPMRERHAQHSKTLRGFVRELMRDVDLDLLAADRHETDVLQKALGELDSSLSDGRHYSWEDFVELLSRALGGAAFKEGVGFVVPEEGHDLTSMERRRCFFDDAEKQFETIFKDHQTEGVRRQPPETREEYSQLLPRDEYGGSDYAWRASPTGGSRETPTGVRSGSGDGTPGAHVVTPEFGSNSPWSGSNGNVEVTRPNGLGLTQAAGLESGERRMPNGIVKTNGGGGSHGRDEHIAELERRMKALKASAAPKSPSQGTQAGARDLTFSARSRTLHETSEAIECRMVNKEEPAVSRDGFERKAPLTREQDDEVEECLGMGPPNQVVARGYNAEITRQQMQCLQPLQWLNDEVINMYMKLLDARDEELCGKDPSRRRSHFFSSFFVTKLTQNNYSYSGVRRWTRKVKVFNLDKIFCPVNVGNTHWCMAVIYVQEKRVCYYDSMGSKGSRVTGALMLWLEDEDNDKSEPDGMFDPDEWKVEGTNLATTPQQENGSDCGVFACTFAAYATDSVPFNFSQADMLNIRRRIAWNVLKQRLV